MKKISLFLLFLIVLFGCLLYWAWPQLGIVTGYAAKKTCSYTFISERNIESIKEIDLADFPLSLVTLDLDMEAFSASASILGLKKSKAILRKGLGCTLLQGKDDYKINRIPSQAHTPSSPSELPYLSGNQAEQLQKAFGLAMDKGGEWQKQTTALLVLHRDSLVHEAYIEGFDRDTEILGWSMTKSVCNLLVGMMIKDSLLNLEDKVLYPAWELDERRNITLENLLRMDSGLAWTEEYESVCDITQGLFKEEDFVVFAREKKAEAIPGKTWEYSSGTSNLISGIMRRKFESYQAYLNYPQERLFSKLDLKDVYIETDEAGNLLMSSYMYAKARDWAKLGLLYLHKGQWNDEQLVDEAYINWSVTPGAEPTYGSHIWLNTDHILYPSLPDDAFYFSGYEGQYVFIIPSLELVVVRTGLSKGPPFDMEAVMAEIITGLGL